MTAENILEFLDGNELKYRLFEHEPVYTIEQLDNAGLPEPEKVVKNLFVRDDKKKNYYLVVAPGHKPLDMKTLAEKIPSRKLSFANEQSLMEKMGLERGHVTPLGLLNDKEHSIIAVFDDELCASTIGIHPLRNTATIFVEFDELKELLCKYGVRVELRSL